MRNKKEIWSFSDIAFWKDNSELVAVFYGQMPEIVVFRLDLDQLTREAQSKHFITIYPTNRIFGLKENAMLGETLLGGVHYRSSFRGCTLFSADV